MSVREDSTDFHSSILSSSGKGESASIGSNIFAALEAYERELRTNLDALGAQTKGSKLQRSSQKLDRNSVTRATKDLPSIEDLEDDDELEALARDADANQSLQLSDIHKGFMNELGNSREDLSELVRKMQRSPTHHDQAETNDDSDIAEDSIMDIDSDEVKTDSEGDSIFSSRFASTGEYIPDKNGSADYEYSSFLKGGPVMTLPTIGEDEEVEEENPQPQTSSALSRRFEDTPTPELDQLNLAIAQIQSQYESSGTNPSSVISASVGNSNPSCGRAAEDEHTGGFLSLQEGSSMAMLGKSDEYEEDEEEEVDDKYSKLITKDMGQNLKTDGNAVNVLRDSDTTSSVMEQGKSGNDDFVGSSILSAKQSEQLDAIDMDSGEFIEMPSEVGAPGGEGADDLNDDFESDVYNEPAKDLSASEFIEAPELSEKEKLEDDFLSNELSKRTEGNSVSGFIEMPSEVNEKRNEQVADVLESSSTAQSGVDDGDSGFIQLPSEQGTQLSDDFVEKASVTAPEDSASGFVELPSENSLDGSIELPSDSVQGSIELPKDFESSLMSRRAAAENSLDGSIELPSDSVQGSIELPKDFESSLMPRRAAAENSLDGSIELPSENEDNSVQGSIELPKDFESSLMSRRAAAENSLDGSIELPSDSVQGSIDLRADSIQGSIELPQDSESGLSRQAAENSLDGSITLPSDSSHKDTAQVQSSFAVSGFIEAPSSSVAGVDSSISDAIELPSESDANSNNGDDAIVQSSVSELTDTQKSRSHAVVDDSSEFLAEPSQSGANSAIVESEGVSLSQTTETVKSHQTLLDNDFSGTIDLPSEHSSSGEVIESEPLSNAGNTRADVMDTSLELSTDKNADLAQSVTLSDDFMDEGTTLGRTVSEALRDDFVGSSRTEIHTEATSLSDDFMMESFETEKRRNLADNDRSIIASKLSVLDGIDTEATELSPPSISERSSEFQGTLEEPSRDDLDIPIPVIPKSLAKHLHESSETRKKKSSTREPEKVSERRTKREALKPKQEENRSPRRTKVKLAISETFDCPSKYEPDDEEVFVDDLTVSEIDSQDKKVEATKMEFQPQRHLSFTPVVVQKDIRPKKKKKKRHHNHTEMTPHVHGFSRERTREPEYYSQTPQPQRQRGTSISFSRTILGGSTLVPNAAEMIDQNFINTIQSARQQLAHIRESISSSRRTRAMRESGASSFNYTQNPFSTVAYP